ncbi:MAG: single-stranded-DNA-specific exonuclease RecJ [Candidatus Doudnabacteria bacterium]|nr:single-stranded-DNA-specific exonuclease RecJ [Candidatus Doudnabacteria bacterium]
MQKIWKLKENVSAEDLKVYENLPSVLAKILYNRKIRDEEAVKEFLDPKYEGLNAPFLFLDMEKAVNRIWKAIELGEKICIYGDYDADAVTANAVLRLAFKELGANVYSYIPDRFTEGYGVNLDAVLKIKESGTKIIITVDCGTNSCDVADWCLENGVDFIITDHHEIIGPTPQAFALINPKNPSDTYPYRDITGVGVAFKLASAVLQNLKSEILNPKLKPGWEKWLLDLVAIGTVADCHELLGENRILVKYGLKVLEKTKWQGLKALCNKAGLDFKTKKPDAYTLGFVLAPRLNAAGRLEHADVALGVLLEEDPIAAGEKAEYLETVNKRRQELTERIMSEAREEAQKIADRNFLVLMGEGWSKGVVGLAAGKIAEEFNKPTIVLSKEGDYATGSARTVGEFSIIDALKYASENLVRFGGHKQAAGLTLHAGNFENFYLKVLEFTKSNLRPDDLIASVEIEAELLVSELDLYTASALMILEPYGVGNPAPKFLIRDLDVVSHKIVGQGSKHVQLQLQKENKTFSAIGFNMGSKIANILNGSKVQAVCELLEDSWNGQKKLKLKILDIKIQ